MHTAQEDTRDRSEAAELPSFFKLSSEDLPTGDFEEEVYTTGQVVFRVNSMPYGLYYVKSGKVKVFKYGSDGKEQILTIAGEGRFLGYKDLLANRRYTSGATVVEDARLVFIPKAVFQQIFRSDDASDYFTNLLCRDLIEAEERMVSMAYKPVRGRLAESLLNLSNTYKHHGHGIELTREDLANFVGTAKETVIRLLSEFKTEKLIRIDGRSIEILSEPGLQRILGLYR
ncbi:MAG: Crp/Fnr family transcriptional regulator [Roseivirga sp.]